MRKNETVYLHLSQDPRGKTSVREMVARIRSLYGVEGGDPTPAIPLPDGRAFVLKPDGSRDAEMIVYPPSRRRPASARAAATDTSNSSDNSQPHEGDQQEIHFDVDWPRDLQAVCRSAFRDQFEKQRLHRWHFRKYSYRISLPHGWTLWIWVRGARLHLTLRPPKKKLPAPEVSAEEHLAA